MSDYQLAQLNVAAMKAPLDSPVMAEFVANIDRINALAEASPGFVWRLQEEGDATALRPFGEDQLVNLSVWADLDALRQFMFKTDHAPIMRRRAEWFVPMSEAHVVFWWVPAGHRPSLAEAKARLDHLRAHGATPWAFSIRQSFPKPLAEGAAESPVAVAPMP